MSQHAGLSIERWAEFTLDQQILMIGNEMHRAGKMMRADDGARRRNAYERALYLTDLTVQLHARHGLRRELLRWRDHLAQLYLDESPDPRTHREVFRVLLRFTPEASRQIPHVIG